MLALVSLLVVGACAAGQMTDVHVVDVACGAGHFDGFFGGVVGTGASSIEYEHAEGLMLGSCGNVCGRMGGGKYRWEVARLSFSR